jgi:hypothetical protein
MIASSCHTSCHPSVVLVVAHFPDVELAHEGRRAL